MRVKWGTKKPGSYGVGVQLLPDPDGRLINRYTKVRVLRRGR